MLASPWRSCPRGISWQWQPLHQVQCLSGRRGNLSKRFCGPIRFLKCLYRPKYRPKVLLISVMLLGEGHLQGRHTSNALPLCRWSLERGESRDCYALRRTEGFASPPRRGGCTQGRSKRAGSQASPCMSARRRASRPEGWLRGRSGAPLCDPGSRRPPGARRT